MSRRSERRQRRRQESSERRLEPGEEWGRRRSKRVRDRERSVEPGYSRAERPRGAEDEGVWYRGGRNR